MSCHLESVLLGNGGQNESIKPPPPHFKVVGVFLVTVILQKFL